MLTVLFAISAICFFIVFLVVGQIPWPDVICDAVVSVCLAAVITDMSKQKRCNE
jgi:hypothetical protein